MKLPLYYVFASKLTLWLGVSTTASMGSGPYIHRFGEAGGHTLSDLLLVLVLFLHAG
jgi:hypothetical protein